MYICKRIVTAHQNFQSGACDDNESERIMMLDFKIVRNPKTGEKTVTTSITGKALLTIPQLNKSTAFSREERHAFGLLGKLPHRLESLEEQVMRAYQQFLSYQTPIQQHIYLNNLHDKNQVLFYKLISEHLEDMLPIIYTPIVGKAVKRYSLEYRQPRGLYIAHTDLTYIHEILQNRSNPEIDLIVVTDGEGVLGIGDQGIGGMDIPVAKLMVYSLCGGIDPTRTLPIFLDMGTNNQLLLNDPMYLGCQHPRIQGEVYDQCIHIFVDAIKNHFPNAFLHWEDLGRDNARRILNQYQNSLCTFNDDIQGTGAVTLAAMLAACEVTKIPLHENRIVVFGAGSAGTGISDQIVEAMVKCGLSRDEAYKHFWLIDRQGLLVQNDPGLTSFQKPYARELAEISDWSTTNLGYPSLLETIKQMKPTILIGCSAQTGAFTQEIIELMTLHCKRPVIFPLSNPDEKCEARPLDLWNWTQGKALIATGTRFEPIHEHNRFIEIAQCNNALIFPGIGLGIFAVSASRLTNNMIWEASKALAHCSPIHDNPHASLLPSLKNAQEIAKHVALAVAQTAILDGVAQKNQKANLVEWLEDNFWMPSYLPFEYKNT